MSWTDVFPLLTDDQVTDYQKNATAGEMAELEDWFGVDRTINARESRHVVSASLFWKNCKPWQPELPPVTRELMMNAVELGLVSRYAPWDHYVQPLLDGAAILARERPDVVFRVYLAADLDFLIPDLVEAGCEIKLMRSSSIRHNPGALWRFLAFAEKDRWVTITDSDIARRILAVVERTEQTIAAGLGMWRLPYIFGSVHSDNHPGYYRPINASQFGAAGGLPMEQLLKAFLWHTLRGTMPDKCTMDYKKGKRNQLPIYGTTWPTYGFDEWFLIAAFYPRMAFEGVLTFYPINQREANHWYALDIEYVTWANPKSEILYFGKSRLLETKTATPKIKSPKSRILKRMLVGKDKESDNLIKFPHPHRQDPLTLVIARYKEDLGWLMDVPEDVNVVVYNKGPDITDEPLIGRINHLIPLPNEGRESDTYLHHLQHFQHAADHTWTVFCQGDPFPHSPDFIRLLHHRDAWKDIQPLTSAYLHDGISPPTLLLTLETDEWVRGIPVRTELLSSATLHMVRWHDPAGAKYIEGYSHHYGLTPGWSVTGHFLESCGLTTMAEEAWQATLVRGVYAAIFGVRNRQLSTIPKRCIPRMRKLTCEHPSVGYVYERLWLHLFGLPFIRLVENGNTAVAEEKIQLTAIQ